MSLFKRIREIVISAVMLLIAFRLVLFPKHSYFIVAIIVSLSLYLYSIKQLWYYCTMARHMVGGKSILIQAVILLDAALLIDAMTTVSDLAVAFYLPGILAFTGVVDILRYIEDKKMGASWKFKFIGGIINISFAAALLIGGLLFGNTSFLVYGYSISLFVSALIRIFNAFRKTSVAYFQ